jgi:hypothetical protein
LLGWQKSLIFVERGVISYRIRLEWDSLAVAQGDNGMALNGNGVTSNGNHGSAARALLSVSSTPRCPRRIVLLEDSDQSKPALVLAEYQGADVSGKRLHADIQRLASEHLGRCIAAEWLTSQGWARFLWCRKEK